MVKNRLIPLELLTVSDKTLASILQPTLHIAIVGVHEELNQS